MMRQAVPVSSVPMRRVSVPSVVHHPSSSLRCRAFPGDAEAIKNSISNIPLPAPVSELLADTDAWASQLQPHFGTKAISEAVGSLAARAPQPPHLEVPSVEFPSVDLGNAVAGALEPLGTAAAKLTAASAPSLPAPPALPLFDQLIVSPADLDLGLGQAAASKLSAAVAAAADAVRGGSAAAGGADGVREALAAAAGGGGGELPPHFGTAAAVRGVETLAGWVSERFSGSLELLDPTTAASLTSALSDLRGVAGIMTLPPALGAAGSATLQQLGTTVSALAVALRGLAGQGSEAVTNGPATLMASVAAAYAQAQENGVGGHSLATVAVVTAFTLAAVAASTPGPDYQGPQDPYLYSNDDTLSHEYDPDVVAAYFARRPLAVVQRSAQVAAEAASFGAALLLDMWTGRLAANEQQRAEQLRGIVERLGPAYVKVAQALSTRVDLLTPAYFQQIQLLQDRVPPFPCEEARQEMEKAFGGRPIEAVFSFLSDKPVAAASLGQVYRGTLRPELGGEDVAVKVQRPGVLEQVAVDLLIMRRVAVIMKEQLKMNTDWAAVIDAWAVRFFHELDYRREAANAATFKQQMAAAGVEGITVAEVRTDLSSGCVLTTDWVEGEKLSESNAADVRELCNTLLNAYLIQLLDTGFLHADPHPGNLIRTPEGKICVLDFGLMTEVTPEQRVALVEYIAHLSTQDWEKLALDLQTLGFIPPEVDTQQAGLVEPLGRVMVQLVGGGGAAKVNIDKVTADLEELGDRYPIQVPPFFALILRAFSVIEGIALRVDPDYAIVAECFPYLARRLLNDDSPRMRATLRDLLYGGKQRMDVERLIRVADGLSAFTTDGLAGGAAGGAAGAGSLASAARMAGVVTAERQAIAAGPAGAPVAVVTVEEKAVLSPVVVDTLRSVLRPGSYISELLVEELVAAVDALSRDTLSRIVGGVLLSAPATVSLRSVEALGPLRSVLLPLPTPVEVLARVAPAVAVTQEDQEALVLVRAILTLFQRLAQAEAAAARSRPTTALAPLPGTPGVAPALGQVSSADAARAARLANELRTLLPDLAPGLAYTSDLFVRTLVRRVSVRVTEAARLVTTTGGVTLGPGRIGAGARAASAVAPPAAAPSQPVIAMRMMGPPPSTGPAAAGAGPLRPQSQPQPPQRR